MMNIFWAYVWDKRLKISKYILMKAHEGKDENIVMNGPKPNETRGKVHEKKGSDFVIGPSLKWT